jgi:antitoxin ParD1/3/4
MSKVAINLREEDRRFIERAVKAGRYFSESEVIADAVSELRAREEVRNIHLDELRGKVAVGLKELDLGQGREWKAHEIPTKGRGATDSRLI